jgi:fatty acid desaturase
VNPGPAGDSGSERSDVRSDLRGALHLGGHVLLLVLTGAGLLRSWGTPWTAPLLVLHGVLLSFLFCASHECVHRTAFRSRLANDAVASMVGVLLVLPSRWFRLFHAAHHRFTQEPGRDPELDGRKPPSRPGIVAQQSGILYWRAMGAITLALVRGTFDAAWMPPFHAEHHAHPQVPFHALPAVHRRWLAERSSGAAASVRWGALDRGYARTVARLQLARWRAAGSM